MGLLPAAARRKRVARNHRGPPPGRRAGVAVAEPRPRAAQVRRSCQTTRCLRAMTRKSRSSRAQHGRQVHLHPSGRVDHTHGPSRLLVPAKSCRLGLVTGFFARRRERRPRPRNSTFMVEMNETANILNNATTARSSSSTRSAAAPRPTTARHRWAVVEHLHRAPERGPRHSSRRTTRSSHNRQAPVAAAQSLRCREGVERGNRLRPPRDSGAADRSYGIQVARLAGLRSA